MLTAERNELLTRVGRGTPVGELFRRYWLPALLATELPEPDCAPVRVKLLGECLVAFRDSSGRLGLIEEFCAHRGVSLWFGRNGENGIGCPYHGWKYDGSRVPPAHRYGHKRLQESNALQAMEGALDSVHSGYLHRHSVADDPLLKRDPASLAMLLADRHPKIVPTGSPAGLYVATRRDVGTDRYYWRVTQWLMPCFSFFPPYGDNPYGGHAFVPIDDGHCWTFSIDYHPERALTGAEREAAHAGRGIHVPLIEGSFIPVANRRNDYLIDRAAQKAKKTFSGVFGVGVQDAAVQESMGAIQDRSREHLVSSDNGIVKTRKRLMDAAKAVERRLAPPGLDPAAQRARAVAMVEIGRA